MLANGRETNRKEEEYITTQMATGILFVFSIHQCLSSHRYEGLFSAGKFNGKGIFFYGSLDKYEGDFINGRWGGSHQPRHLSVQA